MRTKNTGLRKRCARGAFTLVETIVAMAVLSIVAFSVYAGLGLGFMSVQMSRENLRATQILTEKMEVVRLCSFDQLVHGYLPTNFTSYYYEGPTATNGAVYTGTLSVASAGLAVNYSNDLRKVTVSVSWQTQNLQRSRQLSTLVASNGIQSYVFN